MTSHVTSADGTRIAYETIGSGPALILVDGAMCSRALGPARKMAAALADDFAVTIYDRRGRGESTNTEPYAVGREIEDLEALIDAAGGTASLFGQSSGAALALLAAGAGLPVERLVTYEAPFYADDEHEPLAPDFVDRLHAHIAAGRPGAAAKQFFRQVGMPRPMIALMPLTPMWKHLKAAARTLPHDFAILDGRQTGEPVPPGLWPHASMPALVLAGGKSPRYMLHAQEQIADRLPDARYEVLPGQTHMLKPQAAAPLVTRFLTEPVAHAVT